MKLANSVSIRAFYSSEDDRDLFEDAFFDLVCLDREELAKEKISLEEIHAKGFSNKQIDIYHVLLEKDRYCNAVLDKLKENLSKEDKELIISQENRLDAHLNFFLRLDKNLLLDDVWKITDLGNCFHIRINIAAFTKKKEMAKELLKKMFL